MSRARDNADLGDSYGSLGAGVTGGSGLTALASNPTVTLGSNATFPAGHTINHVTVGRETGSAIYTNGTAYVDTGIEVDITTVASSTNSYLIYEYWGGMFHTPSDGSGFNAAATMRTVSNSTYTAGELVYTATYPSYVSFPSQTVYMPIFIRNYCGLVSGMGMPATKSSWAAGDTLYFRLFFKQESGTRSQFAHISSSYNVSLTEVSR